MARTYLVVGVSVVIGVVLIGTTLIVSGWHTRSQERPVPGWVTTAGTVVGIRTVDDGRRDVYGPVVSFADAAGSTHRFTGPTSSDRPTVGDPATVSYNPRNPAEAHDLSASGMSWAAPFVTGIFILSFAGLMLLLIGWLLIHRYRHKSISIQSPMPPVAASPRASAVVTWLPRLSTVPLAVVVYIVVRSSSHHDLTALTATAIYLVIAFSFLSYLARLKRRQHSDAAAPTHNDVAR